MDQVDESGILVDVDQFLPGGEDGGGKVVVVIVVGAEGGQGDRVENSCGSLTDGRGLCSSSTSSTFGMPRGWVRVKRHRCPRVPA